MWNWDYHVQTLRWSLRTDWDQLALQKFVVGVYVAQTLSCWATSKQEAPRLWWHVQKMLPLLPKQPGKTQQGDSLCTKAVSEELILSETTPVTLRDQYAIFFFYISKKPLMEEQGNTAEYEKGSVIRRVVEALLRLWRVWCLTRLCSLSLMSSPQPACPPQYAPVTRQQGYVPGWTRHFVFISLISLLPNTQGTSLTIHPLGMDKYHLC